MRIKVWDSYITKDKGFTRFAWDCINAFSPSLSTSFLLHAWPLEDGQSPFQAGQTLEFDSD